MKFWAAIGMLVAAVALGAIGSVTFERYVYFNGININLKLYAVVGSLALIAVCSFALMLRRKKLP